MTVYTFKVITAGDGGVGKTTLLHRYVEGIFLADTKMTLGVEFLSKTVGVDDDQIMLQLWDFGGQEQFRFMLKNYVLGAKGAIIMFDLTRTSTLMHIEEWVNLVRSEISNLPILFVGGKLDLVTDEYSIDMDYILKLKDEHEFLDLIRVSSKTGEHIDEAFKVLSREIVKRA